MLRKNKASLNPKHRSRKLGLKILGIVLVYLALVILPYIRQPEVTLQTKQELRASDFYGEAPGKERACIISDNGEALAQRIRLISQAQEEIILSTFDFDADNSGKMLLSALGDAADRGVQVKLLVDGFSYMSGIRGNSWFLALTQKENVEFKVYNPIHFLKPWTLMGRLHDKYLIADHTAYILGGRNSYDYFLGDHDGYKNYDWDVLVYCQKAEKNSSLDELLRYFDSVWELSVCHEAGDFVPFWKESQVNQKIRELEALYEKMQQDHQDWFLEADYPALTVPVNRIRLVSNPIHIYPKEPVVFYTITQLMAQAEESVSFHTPYILCNEWMKDCLAGICSNVPYVQMMTNSVANNGNPFGAMDYRENKQKLMDTGVQILEYDGGISYHGKCFTIDDRLSGVGSFNWDMRSAYLDTELMLVIDSQDLNSQLKEKMSEYEKDALKVTGISSYDLKEGQVPQSLTGRRKFRIIVIRLFAYWARFLM